MFYACLLPLRHKAREVRRIREEVEDGFDWVGKPLLGVVGMTHRGEPTDRVQVPHKKEETPARVPLRDNKFRMLEVAAIKA